MRPGCHAPCVKALLRTLRDSTVTHSARAAEAKARNRHTRMYTRANRRHNAVAVFINPNPSTESLQSINPNPYRVDTRYTINADAAGALAAVGAGAGAGTDHSRGHALALYGAVCGGGIFSPGAACVSSSSLSAFASFSVSACAFASCVSVCAHTSCISYIICHMSYFFCVCMCTCM